MHCTVSIILADHPPPPIRNLEPALVENFSNSHLYACITYYTSCDRTIWWLQCYVLYCRPKHEVQWPEIGDALLTVRNLVNSHVIATYPKVQCCTVQYMQIQAAVLVVLSKLHCCWTAGVTSSLHYLSDSPQKPIFWVPIYKDFMSHFLPRTLTISLLYKSAMYFVPVCTVQHVDLWTTVQYIHYEHKLFVWCAQCSVFVRFLCGSTPERDPRIVSQLCGSQSSFNDC
jgi:hypothetical protein